MLKIVYSMAELDTVQLIEMYKEDDFNEADLISYLCEDFFQQKDAFYALWVVEGRYKSALRIEPYDDGLLLEALSTTPCARRMGYGSALVSQVLQYLRSSRYKIVYSHINKKNKPSLELHKKCGFRLFSDSAKYIDGTLTQYSYTMCYYL